MQGSNEQPRLFGPEKDGGCTFCRIISGALESHPVFEDDLSLAFLDHRPLFPGHCLLIPKAHYETLLDLPAELVAPFFSRLQMLARAIEEAMEAEGSFVAVNNRVGQSVPHLHVHVVPRRKKDGLRGFFWPRQRYANAQQMLQTQKILRSVIDRLWAAPDKGPGAL